MSGVRILNGLPSTQNIAGLAGLSPISSLSAMTGLNSVAGLSTVGGIQGIHPLTGMGINTLAPLSGSLGGLGYSSVPLGGLSTLGGLSGLNGLSTLSSLNGIAPLASFHTLTQLAGMGHTLAHAATPRSNALSTCSGTRTSR